MPTTLLRLFYPASIVLRDAFEGSRRRNNVALYRACRSLDPRSLFHRRLHHAQLRYMVYDRCSDATTTPPMHFQPNSTGRAHLPPKPAPCRRTGKSKLLPGLEALSTLPRRRRSCCRSGYSTDAFTQSRKRSARDPSSSQGRVAARPRVVYVKNPDYVPRTEPPTGHRAQGGQGHRSSGSIPRGGTAAQASRRESITGRTYRATTAPLDYQHLTQSFSSFMGTVRFNQLTRLHNVKIRQAVLAVTDSGTTWPRWRRPKNLPPPFLIMSATCQGRMSRDNLSGPRDYTRPNG